MSNIIDPGFFSKQIAADNKRGEFNTKGYNLMMKVLQEALLSNGIEF